MKHYLNLMFGTRRDRIFTYISICMIVLMLQGATVLFATASNAASLHRTLRINASERFQKCVNDAHSTMTPLLGSLYRDNATGVRYDVKGTTAWDLCRVKHLDRFSR